MGGYFIIPIITTIIPLHHTNNGGVLHHIPGRTSRQAAGDQACSAISSAQLSSAHRGSIDVSGCVVCNKRNLLGEFLMPGPFVQKTHP